VREWSLRLGFKKGRWRINDRVYVIGETPIEVTPDTTEVCLLRNGHTSDFSMRFAEPQVHMVHYHNLEHEDGGMMVGMMVGVKGG
jgi:FtsP/CotA-like multicopper oxidase with cupredoxin domain